MGAKEYLDNLYRLDVIIRQDDKELRTLRNSIASVGSFDYSKPSVQTSPKPDATYTDDVERIVDIERKLQSDLSRYLIERNEVVMTIQRLPDARHVDLLYRRYIERKDWDTIASEMNFDSKYILSLYQAALDALDEILQ